MKTTGSVPVESGFEPLSGMDAGFLYMESPTVHMHTLKVAILRPSEGRPSVTFDGFARALERKLVHLPPFRRRIMTPSFALSHPVWVRDPDFSLSRHLDRRTVEAPGGMAELNAIVSEVASRPLRRDRPLWEITMVDGLEGGRVAFVCKLHHAVADGAAALAMLLEVLERHREDEVVSEGGREAPDGAMADVRPASPPPALPSEWALRRWAIGRALRRALDLPRLLLRTLRGVVQVVRRALRGRRRSLPAPFSGPRTSWSGALTPRRSFGTTQLPLADLKQAAKGLGVTVNDVMLAVCGGALRAHLEQVEGGIPRQSLLASVPVNTTPDARGRIQGNHVGHLSVSLCTHIADPVERVRAIHAITDEAKGRLLAFGPDLLESWVEYAPPEPYAALIRYWSGHRMADRIRPPVNLIVSNVPGPRKPLSVGDQGLEAIYSVGPILEGLGLNFTAWSYGDRVNVVGLACPDQIADVQALVDRLPRALEELVEACTAEVSGERAAPLGASEAPGAVTRGAPRERAAEGEAGA